MRAIAAALFLGACTTAASEPPPRGYDFSALQTQIETECAAGVFAGVVAINVSGERAFTHHCGLANIQSGAPITLDATYRIFSTSKLITALTIMRMVERGEIELDAPISRYLTETPASWSSVSVRHLLQHTSGIADLTNDYAEAYCTNNGASGAIRYLMTQAATETLAPQTTPGAVYRYNNFGYELLAELAERRAGAPFAELIRREVFQPGRMAHALLEQGGCAGGAFESAADPNLVTGYVGSASDPRPANPASFVQRGAGAVHADVVDMLALGDALLDHDVVSEASWDAMTNALRAEQGAPEGSGYGLGVVARVTPVRAFGHTGGSNGYITNFDILPEHHAVMVIMSSRVFGHPPPTIRNALYAALVDAAR